MKTKRSFLIFSLILVFTFALSACSNNAATPNSNNAATPDDNNAETQGSTTPEANETAQATPPPLGERRLTITLDDTEVVYATMVDSHASDIFAENLPFTIAMDDYINRNKRGPLPFEIADEDLQNIIYPFEIGDIIYYPPGPLLGIFYEHNGAEISAGYELVAKLDAEGVEAFKKYPGDVTVTVELSE